MKILMICDYFEPINTVGAVRPTEFAKCFEMLGHQVNVLTLENADEHHNNQIINSCRVDRIDVSSDPSFRRYRFFKNLKKLFRIGKNSSSNLEAKTSGQIEKSKKSFLFLNFLKNYYYDELKVVYGQNSGKAFSKHAKRIPFDFDIIYSTYTGFGSLLACEKIKRKFKSVKWIVDIRDAIYYEMFVKTHQHYFKSFLKKHCKKADLLSFVSNGVREDSILPKKFDIAKTAVITNGFLEYRKSCFFKKDNMMLLYAGVIYDERKFTSIFSAIKRLERSEGDLLKIEIDFYGNEVCFQKFKFDANRFNCGKYLKYCGFVNRDALIEIEANNADMLLISSWNYKNYKGVIPGKIFEYMSFQKPILGHVSGDLGDSDIKTIINEGEIGYCADDVDEQSYDGMFDYIKKQYSFFLKNGFCFYSGRKYFTDKFLRIELAKKMINAISGGQSDGYFNK